MEVKQIYGVLSKFMFSVFPKQFKILEQYSNEAEDFFYERYGILYLLNWKDYQGYQIYSYENGVNTENIEADIFL